MASGSGLIDPVPPEDHVCAICGEEFLTYYALGSHLIRHNRERRRARRAERSRSLTQTTSARGNRAGDEVRLVITVEMVRENGEVVRRLFRRSFDPSRRPNHTNNGQED